MRTERVTVLMGGPSLEHDISLVSGKQVATSLEQRWPVQRITIERDGRWVVGGAAVGPGEALDALKASADVVFPAMHGPFGEDGTVQALLEVAGLPYVGSDVAASALAMDKARTKWVYGARGLPTAGFEHFAPGDDPAWVAERAAALFPCVVKVSTNGSSHGVSFPESAEAAGTSSVAHLSAGSEVVVERVLKGLELTCGVLEHDDGPRALPPTAIIPTEGYAFFDLAAKYTPGATNEVTPAPISAEDTARVQQLALAAHRALGCRDMSRTDSIWVEGEGPYLLETNTLPGFTPTSLLPQAAAAAGMSFDTLVDHLVERALARRTARSRPPG